MFGPTNWGYSHLHILTYMCVFVAGVHWDFVLLAHLYGVSFHVSILRGGLSVQASKHMPQRSVTMRHKNITYPKQFYPNYFWNYRYPIWAFPKKFKKYPIPSVFVWVAWHYPPETPVLVELFLITVTDLKFSEFQESVNRGFQTVVRDSWRSRG